jgi:hypothetical protein
MQLYHFTNEQWNNLKAILTDKRDGFTDDQWKLVFHLLNENGLIDKQLEFMWICLKLQHRSWYCCMQVEEQEILLLHVKSLKSWPVDMKVVVARVQPGLALCT